MSLGGEAKSPSLIYHSKDTEGKPDKAVADIDGPGHGRAAGSGCPESAQVCGIKRKFPDREPPFPAVPALLNAMYGENIGLKKKSGEKRIKFLFLG